MSREDDLDQAINLAANTYNSARSELIDALGSMERDDLDEVLSLAEEFGARHVRAMIEHDPEAFGVPAVSPASPARWDALEQKLGRYVDATMEMDRVVTDREEQRYLEGGETTQRVVAFHGELPVVDFVNRTITFPGGAPQPWNLREGKGPEPFEPERTPDRQRSRGPSR